MNMNSDKSLGIIDYKLYTNRSYQRAGQICMEHEMHDNDYRDMIILDTIV